MSEETQAVEGTEEELSFEERFAALEHQAYLIYLQMNSVTQLLVDKGVIGREEIGSGMDAMHSAIEKNISELEEEKTI